LSDWLSRQLLNAKLYHPGWNAILVYSTITYLIPTITALSGIIALFIEQRTSALILGGSFFAYLVLLLILIDLWQRAMQQKLMLRPEILPIFSPITYLKLIAAIPLTQLLCAIALWQAMVAQQVEWRGITYQIKGPWDIKLLEYFPYQYLKRTHPKTSL
jgi:hypothetical protein